MNNTKQKYEAIVANTDTESVEELICNILYLEADSISKIHTFSDAGWAHKGYGLIMTCPDGRKYQLSIKGIR
ncbi:MAG: hypothetical protein ACUZ8H_04635 [Candidatus Anammoxibacter sp.]